MQDENQKISEKTQKFESVVVSGLGLEALQPDSLRRARELACRANPNHAWSLLGDAEILEAMGLLAQSKSGDPCKLTLAALLLLGKREYLQRVLPGRDIQVTAQLLDPEGYDYHESLGGNLLEAYERLTAFAARNFPAGDAIPGMPGMCARDLIFGEIIGNLLAHRDYSVAMPARLVFQKERLTFENPSQPRKGGLVDLARSDSNPPNPLIYAFLEEMGWISTLSSGFGRLLRYGESYFGTQILAFDREIFKIIVTSNLDFPIRQEPGDWAMQGHGSEEVAMQDFTWGRIQPLGRDLDFSYEGMQAGTRAMQDEVVPENQPDRVRRILTFCESPRNREEIQKHIGLNNRDHFRKEVLLPLLRQGLLVATFPDKPNSPKQQYRTAPALVSREP